MLFVVVLSFAGSREHALAAQIRSSSQTTTTAATPEASIPYSNTTTSTPRNKTSTTSSQEVDVPGGTTDAQGEVEEASIPWEELMLLLGNMTVTTTASTYSGDWPNIPDVWNILKDNVNDKMNQIYSLWDNTDFQL